MRGARLYGLVVLVIVAAAFGWAVFRSIRSSAP